MAKTLNYLLSDKGSFKEAVVDILDRLDEDDAEHITEETGRLLNKYINSIDNILKPMVLYVSAKTNNSLYMGIEDIQSLMKDQKNSRTLCIKAYYIKHRKIPYEFIKVLEENDSNAIKIVEWLINMKDDYLNASIFGDVLTPLCIAANNCIPSNKLFNIIKKREENTWFDALLMRLKENKKVLFNKDKTECITYAMRRTTAYEDLCVIIESITEFHDITYFIYCYQEWYKSIREDKMERVIHKIEFSNSIYKHKDICDKLFSKAYELLDINDFQRCIYLLQNMGKLQYVWDNLISKIIGNIAHYARFINVFNLCMCLIQVVSLQLQSELYDYIIHIAKVQTEKVKANDITSMINMIYSMLIFGIGHLDSISHPVVWYWVKHIENLTDIKVKNNSLEEHMLSNTLSTYKILINPDIDDSLIKNPNNGYISNQQIRVEKFLKSLNTQCETEKILQFNGNTKRKCDIYLPKKNLVIEVDGPDHQYINKYYSEPTGKTIRTIIRDKEIEKMGYNLIHYHPHIEKYKDLQDKIYSFDE